MHTANVSGDDSDDEHHGRCGHQWDVWPDDRSDEVDHHRSRGRQRYDRPSGFHHADAELFSESSVRAAVLLGGRIRARSNHARGSRQHQRRDDGCHCCGLLVRSNPLRGLLCIRAVTPLHNIFIVHDDDDGDEPFSRHLDRISATADD